jgi:putative nucleotidyltransferase with HDIG domain
MDHLINFRPIFSSIRIKLTLPYILLALLIALGGGYIVTQVVLGSLEERFTNQLIETRKLASELMLRQENDLLGTLRLLSFTEGVGEAISQGNRNTLLELIYPITFNNEEDAVLVLDQQGGVIFSILKAQDTGEYDLPDLHRNLSSYPFVEKVIHQQTDAIGDKYAGLLNVDGSNYLFVSGPVKDPQQQFAGVILVGRSLDGITDKIREETLSQATLYNVRFQPLSSTFLDLPPTPAIDPQTVFSSDETRSLLRDVDISQIAYAELLSSWKVRAGEDIGILGTAMPKTFLVRTSRITRFNVTAVIIVSILLSMFLGIYLSGLITQPILRLKQAASKVSDGDLNVQLDANGMDEVAVLTQSFNTMVSNLRNSEESMIDAYDKTIDGWSRALELRDHETMGHSSRVADLTLELARALGIEESEMDDIRRGAVLHDIGKMGIPDDILLKPGKLSVAEMDNMRNHPVFARQMLEQIKFLQPAMAIPTHHHEKWDGSGYPDGLAGENIPVGARIFAVIDVWDALTSDRPYRKAWTRKKALRYIQDNAGTHFDPQMVTAFLEIIEQQDGK